MQESSRGYEVLATLIKTTAETTKDLYQLQKTTRDLKEGGYRDDPRKKNKEESIQVDKAVFIGSASELLDKIKNE